MNKVKKVTNRFLSLILAVAMASSLVPASVTVMAAVPQAFQWIFAAIRKMHDDERYVFVHDARRLNTNCIRKRFSRVCDKAGVPHQSPHKIRKTYCSILFENGVDPKLITDQMGHTDIMCSEMYYHKNRKSLGEKVETISAIPDFRAKMTRIV